MATATREFQVLAKPIGAVCNLDCRYCYYLAKKDRYPQAGSFRMADGLLESYIAQHLDACPRETVLFSWHGGEPTVLGIDYFRRIVELQRQYRPPGREIINGIQTNGTLIDEAWCRFFAEERFYVGLSIDGPHELHDRYRVTSEHRLGNVRETPLLTLLESSRLRAFGARKRDALPRYCRECEMLCQCHGGCPKDRLARAPILFFVRGG